MRLSVPARIYLWGAVVIALGVLAWWSHAWRHEGPLSWGLLALLGVLAIAALHFPLMLTPRYKVNVAIAAYFAALLLFGPPVAMALVFACQLLGGFTLSLRRNRQTGQALRTLRSVWFNAGQIALAIGAGGAVYYVFLPQQAPAPFNTIANLWALPAAAGTIYLVNSGAVAGMIALQLGKPLLAVWRDGRQQDALQFAGLFLLGLVTALAATAYPWSPLLMVLPAAAIYLSLKRSLQLLEERLAAAEARAEAADLHDRYAREHARRMAELTALHGAGQVLAGEATREPYLALLGALRAVVPCAAAGCYAVDGTGATGLRAAIGPASLEALGAGSERCAVGWVMARALPLSLNQPDDWPTELLPAGAARAGRWLVVPLLAGGQTWGALVLRREDGPVFTGDELRLTEAVAAQAAVVLHNARLHSQAIAVAADLRAVLESIEQGVLMTSSDGRIRFANQRLGALLDLDAKALAGRLKREAVDNELAGRARVPAAFMARLYWLDAHPGEAVTDEVALTGVSGRTLERYAGPLRDPRDGSLAGQIEVYTDVTETRRLERAKDEFLATASHELKTPITTLGGYLELLQHQLARAEGPDLDRLDRYTSTAQSELRRLRRLSEDLLEVARIQAGRLSLHPAPLDLAALARETVARFAGRPGLRERGYRLICRAAEPIRGYCDTFRIEQVLTNLLENACKYSPDGGDVVVQVRRCASEAVLAVRDNGIGVAPEEREKLFQPFYRADNASAGSPEGLGLGLYISRGIIEGHGGRLWVEPAPGGGSIFQIALPLLADAPTETSPNLQLDSVDAGMDWRAVGPD
jgi:signal transduction histidine kinase